MMDDVWEPWVPESRNQEAKGEVIIWAVERVGLLHTQGRMCGTRDPQGASWYSFD